mgnify:FL=1
MGTQHTKENIKENKITTKSQKLNNFYNSLGRLLTNDANVCKFQKKIVEKLLVILVPELNKQNVKHKVII